MQFLGRLESTNRHGGQLKIGRWFALRGTTFVLERGTALLSRYGVTPTKAKERIMACMATLARYGCAPTFPTPGRVVRQYSRFIRQLQEMGAEIAVHSYDHVDLKAYSPAEASRQLVRAARTFEQLGLEVHGFRCPYLSCTDELVDALPMGMFGYSSNAAIRWDSIAYVGSASKNAFVDTISSFYQPRNANDIACVPWTRADKIEIPVCVPDDLQLHDGVHLEAQKVAQVWTEILNQTHNRGDLFTLLFHPELAEHSEELFGAVLQQARSLQPGVWIARLCDISDWWREKSNFGVAVSRTTSGLHLSFNCSDRATILTKGLATKESEPCWDGAYRSLKAPNLDVPAQPRPFVGLPADTSERVTTFLREQGYILDLGEMAMQCSAYIDATTLAYLDNQVKLIQYIEASPGPLVRYWRWPNGLKSALCISGDLDALTLLDYISRLFVR